MAENKTETAVQKTSIGISLPLVDEDTGVPAAFHTLGTLYLDLANGYHTAVVHSYFNRKMYDAGKHPLGKGVSVSLQGNPTRGADIIDWVLRSVTAQTDNADNPFAGAQLVYAE